MYVFPLSYDLLLLDVLFRKMVWHTSLTVRHVDLESIVPGSCVQHDFRLFWVHRAFLAPKVTGLQLRRGNRWLEGGSVRSLLSAFRDALPRFR